MEEITGFTPGPENPQPFSAGPQLQPSYDVLDALAGAPTAAERLRGLRQRAADAHAVIPRFDDVREASMAKIGAANALKRLTDHPHDGGFGLKLDDRQVIAAQRTLDKATDDFERIKQRSETKTAAWQAASSALANTETWLKVGKPSGVLMQDHETEVPKLAKGEAGLLDAIENRRRRVRELKADLHRIASAPYPSKHVKAKMRAQIEAFAAQGAPDVSMMAEHDGKIVWPTQRVRAQVIGAEQRALAFAEVRDAVALVAWLHRDALIERLEAEIDTVSDDPASLSDEARQKAEAGVMGNLLDIERQEAALVFAAWEHGLACEHRSDCSPVALLSVRLVTAPRAAALPATSPELVVEIARPGRR